MIVPVEVPDDRRGTFLGRASPLTKLGVAVGWLVCNGRSVKITCPQCTASNFSNHRIRGAGIPAAASQASRSSLRLPLTKYQSI